MTHSAPDGAIVQFLLTDGTVLVQGARGQDWWKLTPDNTGSYINGAWTQVASLASNYDPLYFASQVLADGRVLIEGGEYNFGQFVLTNLGAVYDPAANTWTPLTPPPGWDYIGDSPSTSERPLWLSVALTLSPANNQALQSSACSQGRCRVTDLTSETAVGLPCHFQVITLKLRGNGHQVAILAVR